MFKFISIVSVVFAVLITGACASNLAGDPIHRSNRLVVEWNETVMNIAEAEDGFLTLKGLRTATMMHLAMHDSINAVTGNYESYGKGGVVPGANPVIAATEAAYRVAVDQYPDQEAALAALKLKWLTNSQAGTTDANSMALGERTAKAVLASRQNDGWDTEADYAWHPMAPGVYAEFHEHSATPQGFIFGAGWGKAKGFALKSPDQFRAPPPPAINSEAYTVAFNEVKEVGSHQSAVRTVDQTHLAMWWKDFAENSHNRLARQLIIEEDLELAEASRLMALVNMSVFDAYVSVFDNKFHFNHWRPYTAIRWADNDGNPDTEPDPDWTNTHQHTYAFPSYPSAHGTACSAAMTAFASVFGDAYPFTMTTPQVDKAGPFSGKIDMVPTIRQFASFDAAAEECALSRVYLGIHFRYDSTEGVKLGQLVGDNVRAHLLRPASN